MSKLSPFEQHLIRSAASRAFNLDAFKRPAAPSRTSYEDPRLADEVARLEAVIAAREAQMTAARATHAQAIAGLADELASLDARDAVLTSERDGLRTSAAADDAEAAAVLAAAAASAEQLRAHATTQRADAAKLDDALAASTRQRADVARRAAEAPAQLDAELRHLAHGKYADAQRRLPELRARLARRSAPVTVTTPPAPSPAVADAAAQLAADLAAQGVPVVKAVVDGQETFIVGAAPDAPEAK